MHPLHAGLLKPATSNHPILNRGVPGGNTPLALTFAEPVMPREPAWLDACAINGRRPKTEEGEFEEMYRAAREEDASPYNQW